MKVGIRLETRPVFVASYVPEGFDDRRPADVPEEKVSEWDLAVRMFKRAQLEMARAYGSRKMDFNDWSDLARYFIIALMVAALGIGFAVAWLIFR